MKSKIYQYVSECFETALLENHYSQMLDWDDEVLAGDMYDYSILGNYEFDYVLEAVKLFRVSPEYKAIVQEFDKIMFD
jgi:hypothetical protein